ASAARERTTVASRRSIESKTARSGPETALSGPRSSVTQRAKRELRALGDSAGAVEAAVTGEAVDANDGAGVWRVDELAAADVDAHVAEAVEEDEVARLHLRLRDRQRRVPLRDGVVRQRDPELGID